MVVLNEIKFRARVHKHETAIKILLLYCISSIFAYEFIHYLLHRKVRVRDYNSIAKLSDKKTPSFCATNNSYWNCEVEKSGTMNTKSRIAFFRMLNNVTGRYYLFLQHRDFDWIAQTNETERTLFPLYWKPCTRY